MMDDVMFEDKDYAFTLLDDHVDDLMIFYADSFF
jgi:hypothetical protein